MGGTPCTTRPAEGQVSALGGSGPRHAPLGRRSSRASVWERKPPRSALLAASTSPETGSRACGFCLRPPPSFLALVLLNAEAPRATCSMPRGEKGEAEAGSCLMAFAHVPSLPLGGKRRLHSTVWGRRLPASFPDTVTLMPFSFFSRLLQVSVVSSSACRDPVPHQLRGRVNLECGVRDAAGPSCYERGLCKFFLPS